MLSNCGSCVASTEPQRGPTLREEDESRRVDFEVNYRKENALPIMYKYITCRPKKQLWKAQNLKKKTWMLDAKREETEASTSIPRIGAQMAL